MNDYYVKWNGQMQKRFNSTNEALAWCEKTDAAYPSKHPYTCYYKTGDLQFTFHHDPIR